MAVLAIGERHVPVDVEADAVGPGVRRERAVVLVAGVDDLLHLCHTAGEARVRLVDVEAVLLEHDLDLVPTVVELGAGDLHLRDLLQRGQPVVVVPVERLFEPRDAVVCARTSEIRVLGQKPVTGVNRIDIADFCSGNDLVDLEIALGARRAADARALRLDVAPVHASPGVDAPVALAAEAAIVRAGNRPALRGRLSMARAALEKVGMVDYSNRQISQLSGGQQQRLTIARALSHEPEILCLDEFSIAIDPVTTMRIEDVLKELKQEMTIILVTNLVQQARRLASRTAFFLNGECVEIGETEDLFTGEVKDSRTRDYVEGRFG